MVPDLETSRLKLRPLSLADVDELQAAFPRWEIVQYLGHHVPWPYPPDGALTYVRDRAMPAMQAGHQWHWGIRPKVPPVSFIGVISLMRGDDNNRGFWLSPEWQGQGLMTEACIAINDFWFDVLGEEVLRVPKAIGNIRSCRLSERMGMRVTATREQDFVIGRCATELWEITRDEWRCWKAERRLGG